MYAKPFPNFRPGEYPPGPEPGSCISENPQIPLHDSRCTAVTRDNDRIYILRTYGGTAMEGDEGFVRGQSLRRTSVLVRLENICEPGKRVPQPGC